ncbi:peptidoglycan-binding domain-containing protein [Lewinella cohaerens]|uniref:peptidoglycan-binding domain-containing protein n=1 Tax=Lewinella cohaerens TaxID=70995 RepID=UPI00038179A6|nr:peptidoglycan-binding domain-containing protein [Lewinella cohaerens]
MNKLLILLLLGSFSIWQPLTGQDYYTAFVGSFVEVRPQDFSKIRSLGFLYVQTGEGNLQQVFLGQYPKVTAAEGVVEALQAEGFTSAQALPGKYTQGIDVPVIQIATRYSSKVINWQDLSKAGPLNVLLADGAVKVLTGTFPDVETAKAQLPRIRSLGFEDAFVKMVNSGRLLPVTNLATGIKEDLIPLNLSDQNTVPPTEARGPGTPVRPEEMEVSESGIITKNPPTVPRPSTPTIPTPPANNSTTSPIEQPVSVVSSAEEKPVSRLPEIRGNVKRNSVIALQRVLKNSGFYQSSLDGYYGTGTTQAYEQMRTQDFTVRKYQQLIPFYQNVNATKKQNALQLAIRELPYDPNAPLVIEGDQTAIGLAYQAYLSFTSLGASAGVNQLMNDAIKAAYLNSGVSTSVFNYRATYAYQGLDQLLLHLFYVHAAPAVSYLLPCWVNDRHPAATQSALEQMGDYRRLLQQENCGTFTAWPEVQLLQTIAMDLNPAAITQTEALQEAAGRQNILYYQTQGLPATEATILETWQQNLFRNVDRWSGADPLLAPTAQALKMAYFQAQVRIEDHFLDQGVTEAIARQLSIASLRAIAGVPLKRFE